MKKSRCLAHSVCSTSRRDFIKKSTLITAGSVLAGNLGALALENRLPVPVPRPYGPASSYIPRINAAFVRRKENYGMWWPGAVYDGEEALKKYTYELNKAKKDLGLEIKIKPTPLFSLGEAKNWLDSARDEDVDGLVLILLDRQQHTWPTAAQASDSGIPTVIFSPLGTSFTSNTEQFAGKPGCVVYSTNNFAQCHFGIKMIKAGSLMKRSRCVVIAGNERKEKILADTGITLQYIPASTFIETYNSLQVNDEILEMTMQYIDQARDIRLATREDVINGIKSYLVAGKILKDEKADAISMDCLGSLADKDISLPCISWSRMNDSAIPAACEADTGAIASQIMVQYLFDRPGFQQDPVADTSDDTLIGAHCSCPTKLNGFDQPAEPFEIIHHHGNRDAVPRTIWKTGQRITCLDFLPAQEEKERSEMLISSGTVVDNMSVPPSGGCVVSVKVKMDGGQNVLSFPGFHQLFFYGNYKNEIEDFCKLYNFKATVV